MIFSAHHSSFYSAFACGLLIVTLGTGCVTDALIKSTTAHEWRPSGVEGMCLVVSTNPPGDVAVVFKQHDVGRKSPRTRLAVWKLNQPASRIAVNADRIFAATNTWWRHRMLTLYAADASVPETQSTKPPGFAVLSSDCTSFTVHMDGYPPGPYTLPTTQVKARTGLMLAGLPFAIAADATIVLGVVILFFENPGLVP